MTIERRVDVMVPAGAEAKIRLLAQQYDDAQHRHTAGSLGDRTEIVRAEQLTSQIDAAAWDQLLQEADAAGSGIIISVTWPFAEGNAPLPESTGVERPPSEVWRASRPKASRTAATYERFTEQLEAWADGTGRGQARKPLCPSEIQNRALTEGLRAYAAAKPGQAPVEAPVTYRDGSSGPSFPLRAVPISDVEPDDGREILRMTLLSVRHVEMDVDVDGAWLRNREISLPRPGGLTDQLVYEQSLEQFKIISARGPVTLFLYQTGLAPANVGFYRALINHHRQPGTNPVAVVPFYYAGDDPYARSTAPWTIR